MKFQMRNGLLILACLAAFGVLAGCDQAEKALEKTDLSSELGTTAEASKLIGNAVKSIGSIKDLESAKAALPALKDVDLDLGKNGAKSERHEPRTTGQTDRRCDQGHAAA